MPTEPPFDYSDWAECLFAALAARTKAFAVWEACDRSEPSAQPLRDHLPDDVEPIDQARLEAVKGLSEIMQALAQLPAFAVRNSATWALPLMKLSAAIAELHNGHRSDLLETRKNAERGPQFISGQRQAVACAVVEVFEASGLRANAARRRSVKLLGHAGWRGRKAQDGVIPPVSAGTLFKWAAEIGGEAEGAHRRNFLDQLRMIYRPLIENERQPSVEEAELVAKTLIEAFPLK